MINQADCKEVNNVELYVFLSQGCLEAVFSRQEEVDRLSSLAQQVLEETYISSRVSVTATQLTARYHSLLLTVQVGHLLVSANQSIIL